MFPICNAMDLDGYFEHRFFFTGQHDELANQYLEDFNLKPFYNSKRESDNQIEYSSKLINQINNAINDFKPDLILIHGDTLSAFIGTFCAYYSGIKIGHIESGLRSYDTDNPKPEEFNRKAIDSISDYLFCPTENNVMNLEYEKINGQTYLTGNTIIDTLTKIRHIDIDSHSHDFDYVFSKSKKVILVTLHRKENQGESMRHILESINKLSEREDVFIYAVAHPASIQMFFDVLNPKENIFVSAPINNYYSFLYLLKNAYLIISDSGGIQEEVTYFGKPLIIAREKTERPECLQEITELKNGLKIRTKEGNAILSKNEIVKYAELFLDNNLEYEVFAQKRNTFGDGKATERIIEILKK